MKKLVTASVLSIATYAYAQDSLVYGINTGYGNTAPECCQIAAWYITPMKSPANLLTACRNEGGDFIREFSVREEGTCEAFAAPMGSSYAFECSVPSSAICVRK